VAGITSTYDYKPQSPFKDPLEPRPFPQTTNYLVTYKPAYNTKKVWWNGPSYSSFTARIWRCATTAST
jgi:hypothetical protein